MFQNCFCYQISRVQSNSEESKSALDQNYYSNKLQHQRFREPPFIIQAISFMGIQKYLIDKFIFARKPPSYKIIDSNSEYKYNFGRGKLVNIKGYKQTFDLIDLQKHFIPVIRFEIDQKSKNCSTIEDKVGQKERNRANPLTIIYSHGNGSDIQDSYSFVSLLTQVFKFNFIAYDYTGYSNGVYSAKNYKPNHQISEQSLLEDLQQVIKWSKLPAQQIVLWGFSLGCYATLAVASQIKVAGIILQSPFASIFRLFCNQIDYFESFKNDIFRNIDLIDKVKSNILLIHSQEDQIIPFWHSKSLLKRAEQRGKSIYLRLLQLQMFGHNNLHQAFYSKKPNKLQDQLKLFFYECITFRNYKQIRVNSLTSSQKSIFKRSNQVERHVGDIEVKDDDDLASNDRN